MRTLVLTVPLLLLFVTASALGRTCDSLPPVAFMEYQRGESHGYRMTFTRLDENGVWFEGCYGEGTKSSRGFFEIVNASGVRVLGDWTEQVHQCEAVIWQLRNDDGELVAPGVYTIKIAFGERTATRPILVDQAALSRVNP